jgi:hypothetical protein
MAAANNGSYAMRVSEGCDCPCILVSLVSGDRDAVLNPARHIAGNVGAHCFIKAERKGILKKENGIWPTKNLKKGKHFKVK